MEGKDRSSPPLALMHLEVYPKMHTQYLKFTVNINTQCLEGALAGFLYRLFFLCFRQEREVLLQSLLLTG